MEVQNGTAVKDVHIDDHTLSMTDQLQVHSVSSKIPQINLHAVRSTIASM